MTEKNHYHLQPQSFFSETVKFLTTVWWESRISAKVFGFLVISHDRFIYFLFSLYSSQEVWSLVTINKIWSNNYLYGPHKKNKIKVTVANTDQVKNTLRGVRLPVAYKNNSHCKCIIMYMYVSYSNHFFFAVLLIDVKLPSTNISSWYFHIKSLPIKGTQSKTPDMTLYTLYEFMK